MEPHKWSLPLFVVWAKNTNANQNNENEPDTYDNCIHALEFRSLKGVDIIWKLIHNSLHQEWQHFKCNIDSN